MSIKKDLFIYFFKDRIKIMKYLNHFLHEAQLFGMPYYKEM